MKRIVIFVLFFAASIVFAEEYSVEKVIPDESSSDYGIFDYHLYFYENSNRVKIESVLCEDAIAKYGFTKQITYFKDNIEYAFEMFESEVVTNKTGLISRTEYIDANDNIVSITLLYSDGTIYDINASDLSIIEKFRMYKLKVFIDLYNEYDHGDYNYEAPIYTGITNVIHIKSIRDISEKERKVIQGWQELHDFDDLSHLYTKCIEFDDGSNTCWIAVQNNMLDDYLRFNRLLIYYYYIGGYDDQPIFLGIGFFEPKK